MTTQTEPDPYAENTDIIDKIMDDQSRGEWTRIINRALMEAAARRAAEFRVARLHESVLERILGMAHFPPPLSSETVQYLVPDGKLMQWADLAATLREYYGLSTYETGDHIRRAVKKGLLFAEEQQGLKYLSRSHMTDGINWPKMTKWARTKGPEVVVNLVEEMKRGESKAYQLIETAIEKGILGELKRGKSRILWVKRKDITRVDPELYVPVPEPEPEPLDPNACPEQDDSGLLPPPKKAYPRNFAELWWSRREELGRWDAYTTGQEISDRANILIDWRDANYKH